MVRCTVTPISHDAFLHERELRRLSNEERIALSHWRVLPYSEVCCHMRVAGLGRRVIPVSGHMAQILNHDGSLFSFPITRGEAGITHEQGEL